MDGGSGLPAVVDTTFLIVLYGHTAELALSGLSKGTKHRVKRFMRAGAQKTHAPIQWP